MSVDMIACGHCNGDGYVPLAPQLQAALDYLRKYGPQRAVMLAKHLGCAVTAMNNRLETLRANGHVDRERVARGYAYRACRSRPL